MESKPLNTKDVSSGPTNKVFRLCSQVALEGFEDGALLLQLEDRHLFDLNPTAYRVLVLTDGQRTVSQVAAGLAETYLISESEALQDVLSLYTQLSAQEVIEMVEPARDVKENRGVEEVSATLPRYIRNPDVVLHEEDSEGGLLINPDTKQVRALNNTGMFIWQQCDGTRNLAEITIAVQKVFEEASVDRVAKDVQEFVEDMVASGFIGVTEAMEGGG